tara:strand:+ start:145 stop:474 length:330 start_codon:yes stop_codon:yes gene_type:complete
VIPKILSRFSPIEINAIALFPFVFSRGEMTESTKRHETIHFQQQLETFVIFFYLIYLWDYFKARVLLGLSGRESYFVIRAEREAYIYEEDKTYLQNRARWAWLRTGGVK